MVIVKGTTPTITITFDTVDVSDITAAVLIIKSTSAVMLMKTLSALTVDTDSNAVTYMLTQAESNALTAGKSYIRLNWLLSDGTRGVSALRACTVASNDIDEVMADE